MTTAGNTFTLHPTNVPCAGGLLSLPSLVALSPSTARHCMPATLQAMGGVRIAATTAKLRLRQNLQYKPATRLVLNRQLPPNSYPLVSLPV